MHMCCAFVAWPTQSGGWYSVAKSRQIEVTYDQVELVRSPPAQFVQVLVFCLRGGCPQISKTSSDKTTISSIKKYYKIKQPKKYLN